MPAGSGFVNRDGTASIRKLAQQICMLVATFGPVIRKNYGNDATVAKVLEWAETACTIAPLLDEVQLAYEPPASDVPGGDNSPGVDPNAPQPPEPITPTP